MSLLSSIAHRLTERVRAVRRMASRPRPADRDVGRLFEITFDLMGVASLDGTMLRVNPGIERVLGLAPEEVVGRRLFDIVHPDDREGTVAAFAGVLEAGQLSGFENRLSAADGSYRWLQWNLLAEADERLVYGVARDVTEHRHAERELRALGASSRGAAKSSACSATSRRRSGGSRCSWRGARHRRTCSRPSPARWLTCSARGGSKSFAGSETGA